MQTKYLLQLLPLLAVSASCIPVAGPAILEPKLLARGFNADEADAATNYQVTKRADADTASNYRVERRGTDADTATNYEVTKRADADAATNYS
ncbi:MAG: Transcriptional activator, partial [Chaenotheca gracillima]